jgi:predicted S18 family serine protease
LLLSQTTTAAVKSSPILDKKIEESTAGLSASFVKSLYSISVENAATIVEYITAMKSEVNLSDHSEKDVDNLKE